MENLLTKNDLFKKNIRPWGYYVCIDSGNDYLVKNIFVSPYQKLSIQSHNHRSEIWTILEGKAFVLLDETKQVLEPGDSIYIPLGSKHSLQNPFESELKIIEIQRGDYISENDIIRYEDSYGRV